MLNFNLRATALSCASLIAISAAAVAQNADTAEEGEQPKTLQTVVVKGFKGSLESSVATKRGATSIVEAVTAEDIGKLPDVSIAESLGRLPGLATQRVEGRASVLSIRGLGPDFSTALLNGREQVSVSDNRGVEFDQYPSELLQSAVVYKTPYAGLIGQGLAGTVDMRTVRPLSLSEPIRSINARYEWNEKGALNPDADDKGWRGSATFADKFANDTIGFAIGLAYQNTPTQNEKFNAWGYPNSGPGGALLIGGAKPYVQTNELERTGLVGILEYEPSENFSTAVDLYYSDFAERQVLRGVELPLAWSAAQLQPGATVTDGLVTAGTFAPVNGVIRNDLNLRDAELFALGWNTKFVDGPWTVETDVSYSNADRSDQLIESYSGTSYAAASGGDTLGFVTGGDFTSFSPTINYAGANIVLTDPQGWGAGNGLVQAGFINSPTTEDALTQVRASAKRDFEGSSIAAVEVGVAYSERRKSRAFVQEFLTLGGAQTLAIPAAAQVGGTTGMYFIGFGDQVTYDPLYLVNNVYTRVPVALSSISVPQDWSVQENVVIGYVRADLDANFNGVPVTGNIGLQIVNTDQTSSGFRVRSSGIGSGTLGAVFDPVVDGDTYTDFLPSANLIFAFGEDTQLRIGLARTLARARMDKLNASLDLGTNVTRLTSTDPNQSYFSASGGNPSLRPYISNGIDLSLEHYFSGAGYWAISAYYKDLEDYVNDNDSFIADFTPFIASELTPAQAAQLGTPLGLVSGPTNNGEGWIQGIEGTLSLPFDTLLPALEGLGVISSVSWTDSEVRLGGGAPITVPGLSEWVANTTVYFERAGFEARVSHRFRSEFLAEVSGISATRILRTAAEESIFDAQVGYRFEQGPVDGLYVFVQGTNLTDEPFMTYDGGDSRRVIDYQSYGATYAVGFSYNF